MDAKYFRGSEERSVKHSVDDTGALAHGYSPEYCRFFTPDLFGIPPSQSRFSDFQTRCLRQDMPSNNVGVSFSHVLFRRHPFKVIGSVVGFIAVLVMNKICVFRLWKPTDSHDAVDKTDAAHLKVAVFPALWRYWQKFAEDLSLSGNGVQMIEKSVFNVINKRASHKIVSLVYG